MKLAKSANPKAENLKPITKKEPKFLKYGIGV
jgi:hypothetical protein